MCTRNLSLQAGRRMGKTWTQADARSTLIPIPHHMGWCRGRKAARTQLPGRVVRHMETLRNTKSAGHFARSESSATCVHWRANMHTGAHMRNANTYAWAPLCVCSMPGTLPAARWIVRQLCMRDEYFECQRGWMMRCIGCAYLRTNVKPNRNLSQGVTQT